MCHGDRSFFGFVVIPAERAAHSLRAALQACVAKERRPRRCIIVLLAPTARRLCAAPRASLHEEHVGAANDVTR
jgi:hypothetical protein